MTRWASNTTWLRPKDAKTAQKGAKERATSYWECAMSRWASNTTWLHPKGAKTAQKGAKERATSYWEPAMSCWASNTTWHEPKGTKTPKKGAKRARHVALGLRHDALGLQHDVARAQRRRTAPKGGKKSAPRRIGSTPCRVGPPTRRGSPTSDSIILRQALINGSVVILVASVVAFMEWVEIFS